MDYGLQLPEVSKQSSTALTNFELVALVAGKNIGVASIYLMVDTAMTVTLKTGTGSGGTRKWESYPAANGGVDLNFSDGQFRFVTNDGEALTLTTSGSGEMFIQIKYARGV